MNPEQTLLVRCTLKENFASCTWGKNTFPSHTCTWEKHFAVAHGQKNTLPRKRTLSPLRTGKSTLRSFHNHVVGVRIVWPWRHHHFISLSKCEIPRFATLTKGENTGLGERTGTHTHGENPYPHTGAREKEHFTHTWEKERFTHTRRKNTLHTQTLPTHEERTL